MSTHLLTEDFATRHRAEICAWLRANGVDPDLVPIANVVTVEGDHFEIDVWAGGRPRLVRPPHGKPYVARTTLSVEMVEPWPWSPDWSDWT